MDDALTFLAWKVRVTLQLEEKDLQEIVKDVMELLRDPQLLLDHKKKEVKAMQMIMDVIKGHLIPHKTRKKMKDV